MSFRQRTMAPLVLLAVTVLVSGCVGAGGDPTDPGPIPPPPDPATAFLLEGTWEGRALTEAFEYPLEFQFFLQGVDLRVRVIQAGNLIATPYAAVADDRITIEAENPSGDGGVFQGDLDRTELRIEGTFVARIDGRDESGDFFVDKR